MAKNFKEAVSEVAANTGYTEEYIIDNELVLEYEAEEDKSEFTTWYKDGKELAPGTPIGYSITDNESESDIIPYEGLVERDEDEEEFDRDDAIDTIAMHRTENAEVNELEDVYYEFQYGKLDEMEDYELKIFLRNLNE